LLLLLQQTPQQDIGIVVVWKQNKAAAAPVPNSTDT
jgi:hypothetical protein